MKVTVSGMRNLRMHRENLLKMTHEFNSGHEINQNDFFPDFLAYIDTLSSNDFVFNGEGSYFGKQITVIEDNYFAREDLLCFEVAYDNTQIVIYTANHNGFWVKPYCTVNHDNTMFKAFYRIFVNIMKDKFGLV